MGRTVATPLRNLGADLARARYDVELIASVLLLLDVPPETTQRGIEQLYNLSQPEAGELVGRVLARQPRP